jgi:hypothetical protein
MLSDFTYKEDRFFPFSVLGLAVQVMVPHAIQICESMLDPWVVWELNRVRHYLTMPRIRTRMMLFGEL